MSEVDDLPTRYRGRGDDDPWGNCSFEAACWFGPPYFINNSGHVYDFASLEEVGRYLDQCPTKYRSFVVPREAFQAKKAAHEAAAAGTPT